jgi:hypothetical protein
MPKPPSEIDHSDPPKPPLSGMAKAYAETSCFRTVRAFRPKSGRQIG